MTWHVDLLPFPIKAHALFTPENRPRAPYSRVIYLTQNRSFFWRAMLAQHGSPRNRYRTSPSLYPTGGLPANAARRSPRHCRRCSQSRPSRRPACRRLDPDRYPSPDRRRRGDRCRTRPTGARAVFRPARSRSGDDMERRGLRRMLTYLKRLIAKMKRERFGQSAERGRKLLDQLQTNQSPRYSQAEDSIEDCPPYLRDLNFAQRAAARYGAP